MKVLLVDDTIANIDVLMQTLEPENYSLAIAPNGKKALTIARRLLPDLILLDIMMPDLDGFEVCRQLKKDSSTRDIPVIFITAKSDIKDIIEGFHIGGVDYISKPFYQEEVCARVRTHLQLRKLVEELKHLSSTDQLTGLLNRRTISERIAYEKNRYQRTGKSFCLILCDVDHFKAINDSYGHDAGDHILCEIAELLQTNIRNYDFISRWGGEEFLMLLPDTLLSKGLDAAEKLRQNVAAHDFHYQQHQLNLTLSLGVSEYQDGSTIEACIKQADDCLYQAKKAGRNKVVA